MLDVEWAHAIAPDASIYLVEADDSNDPNLITAAVATAANLPDVSVVSLSFGHLERATDLNLDSVFTTPAGHGPVTFVASTGDDGVPGGYPAFSPNVVAVGGTSLYLHADGSYLSETGWEGSGGGISKYEVPNGSGGTTPPPYQSGLGHGARTTPDVAFDADWTIGVQVINSFGQDPTNPATWLELNVGGTSLSAPCWAGLIAIADQGRVTIGKTPRLGPPKPFLLFTNFPTRTFTTSPWATMV